MNKRELFQGAIALAISTVIPQPVQAKGQWREIVDMHTECRYVQGFKYPATYCKVLYNDGTVEEHYGYAVR